MYAGVVVIGTGQAGFKTALSLRSEGYDGPIKLIGDEPGLPYQRPPLSKAFMLGKQPIEKISLRPESFYTGHRIELITGDPAIEIDRAARTVKLQSGASVEYSV